MIKELENSNISYREVKELAKELTEQEIIDKLGGGDETAGSCASLALAYAANMCGLDVTDYRGGSSQNFFSRHYWQMVSSDDPILPSAVYTARSEIAAGNKALKSVEKGKEYILCAGSHAAAVRRTGEGKGTLQYLELQSRNDNGWTDFDGNSGYTLNWRFGCTRKGANFVSSLTEIDVLKGNERAKKALGYINTATDKQKKGASGHER